MTEHTIEDQRKETPIAVTLGDVLSGLKDMAQNKAQMLGVPPEGCRFHIPPCQRPYCWKLSDIEHVLADVSDMRPAESTTPWYFGPICFRQIDKDEGTVMQIYDGQQRLTSMLLLVWVLAERLEAGKLKLSEEKAEKLRNVAKGASLFEYNHPATVDAVKVMAKRLHRRLALSDASREAEIVVWMLDHVFFSISILRSDVEAAQYFQGENNRGASMTLVDLVKSLNLRLVPPEELARYAALWTNLAAEQPWGTFKGSDAVVRVLLPSMLIARGFWTYGAHWNDPADYRHFKRQAGMLTGSRISSARALDDVGDSLPTLASMPPAGLSFFRTFLWSAVLLAAVRRTLDGKQDDDYEKYIRNKELEPLYLNGLIYWADAFLSDEQNDLKPRFTAFLEDALNQPEQVLPDRLAAAKIVVECANRLSEDTAYRTWSESLRLVLETVRARWSRLAWSRIVRALALDRAGECLLLVPYACGRAEESVAELFSRAMRRPWELATWNKEQLSKVLNHFEDCSNCSDCINAMFKQ